MKKVIEKVFCDDCGKEISSNKPITTIEIIKGTCEFGRIGVHKDFCWECLEWRVNHSMSIIEDKSCPTCKGNGTEKEWTGIGSDYEYKKCKKCGGNGLIHVSKSDTETGYVDGIARCPDCNKEKE